MPTRERRHDGVTQTKQFPAIPAWFTWTSCSHKPH
jgi:hypothetical protein